MNLETNLKRIILKINKSRKNHGSRVHLSIPPFLSGFSWHEARLETLAEMFLVRALAFSRPTEPMCVSVRQMRCMADLEKFFSISPRHWFHLRVEGVSEIGFENTAREVLRDLDFRCLEWIGVEDSEARLGAYCIGSSDTPVLILYIQDKGARRQCDFLIPVAEASAVFAGASADGIEPAYY